MSESKGFYALIASPTFVRLWDGQAWQGEIIEDARIDIIGFVGSLEAIPIEIVADDKSDFSIGKYCVSCSCAVSVDTKNCPACGSFKFSLDEPQMAEMNVEASIEISRDSDEPLGPAGFSRFTVNPPNFSTQTTETSMSHELPSSNPKSILMVTSESVPGSEINTVLGVVVGQGDAFFTTVKARHRNALKEATNHLLQNASLMGADAVIATSYTVAGVRGFFSLAFGQSVTVQISGTAVTLK